MFENRIAVSVTEAARATGYSREAILKAICRDKKLVASRPGGNGDYRILVEDLREWLRGAGQPQVNRPAPNRTTSVA